MTNGKIMSNTFHHFLPYYYGILNPILHNEKSDDYNLNENQIKTLMCIFYLKKVMPTIISKAFNIQKGSLTTIIKSLVSMGLVEKNVVSGNDRSYLLSLTKAGETFVQYKLEKIAQEFDTLFDELPQEEIIKISEALSTLSYYLDKKRQLPITTEE